MALVRTADRSEPACGSVRFIVPDHSPLTSFGRKRFFSSSDACALIASIAPAVSRGQRAKDMLAEVHISTAAAQAVPAIVDEPAVRRGKPVGRGHPALGQGRAPLVTWLVQRREHFAG